jgi:type I restriction enzyme M protein
MSYEPLASLKSLEADLWEAADQLRANSKLTSTEYCMPVLGVIFLRHAANRFAAATKQIEDDQAAGRMPKRKVVKADYIRRRALWLPEISRYDCIAGLPTDRDLGQGPRPGISAVKRWPIPEKKSVVLDPERGGALRKTYKQTNQMR